MSPSHRNEYLHGPSTLTAPGHCGDVFFSVPQFQGGQVTPHPHCQLPPHRWAIPTGYTHTSNFQPSNSTGTKAVGLISSVSFLCSPHQHLQIAVSTRCFHFHTATILLFSPIQLCPVASWILPLLRSPVVLGNKSRRPSPLPSVLLMFVCPLNGSALLSLLPKSLPHTPGLLSLHFPPVP